MLQVHTHPGSPVDLVLKQSRHSIEQQVGTYDNLPPDHACAILTMGNAAEEENTAPPVSASSPACSPHSASYTILGGCTTFEYISDAQASTIQIHRSLYRLYQQYGTNFTCQWVHTKKKCLVVCIFNIFYVLDKCI